MKARRLHSKSLRVCSSEPTTPLARLQAAAAEDAQHGGLFSGPSLSEQQQSRLLQPAAAATPAASSPPARVKLVLTALRTATVLSPTVEVATAATPAATSAQLMAQLISQCLRRVALPDLSDDCRSVFGFPPDTSPSIPLEAYVQRLLTSSRFSSAEIPVVALALLDRLIMRGVCPTNLTLYRLYAGCLLVSIKIIDDKVAKNSWYARVFGVPIEEVNAIERTVLSLLDFAVMLSRDEWLLYAQPVCSLCNMPVPLCHAEESARPTSLRLRSSRRLQSPR